MDGVGEWDEGGVRKWMEWGEWDEGGVRKWMGWESGMRVE